jgi:amino acid transporter
MAMMSQFVSRVRNTVIGKPRDLTDKSLFHKVSLIALFAWVGLGADGLSSSCYGPEETFKALGAHPHMAIFVALASVVTVFVICASYSQIIELFPTGGGGYLVASKLLSPSAGVVSGCALLIDYVLTITISIASSVDALFSLLPPHWQPWKLPVEVAGIGLLMVLNMRGVKESVVVFVPIFFIFVITHAFAILYAIIGHAGGLPEIVSSTAADVRQSHSELGLAGMLLLLLRAYSMGAGTYTGIEAVSNGLPILREPRVQTGKTTMRYMAVSLAGTVAGLLIAYLLYHVHPVDGKTLNAVLFESMTARWSAPVGFGFVLVTLASEAALLFIAAQAGFLDGPRVLANMALDRWFPARFATLSDRLVNQNGILLMGGAGLIVLLLTHGSVDFLVVLYSINVFITFSLSQLGMVRHGWALRGSGAKWRGKLLINGVGFSLTASILASLTFVKFNEGGWITLLITGLLVGLAFCIRQHYNAARAMLTRLDGLVRAADISLSLAKHGKDLATFDPSAKTAVVLVNGFNGLGLHTLLNIVRTFEGLFKNYVFVSVGVVDAGNFKGADEIEHLNRHVRGEADRYVQFMLREGFHAEGITAIGIDALAKVVELAPQITEKYPNAVFFGGQLVFPHDSMVTRWLHNSFVFAAQRRFYHRGYPFLILPIRV